MTDPTAQGAETKVLVTGFGPFKQFSVNPSSEITRRLPPLLGGNIRVIVPDSPIPSAYHAILQTVPKLIGKHDPDLVIHVGLDDGRECFALERSAAKEGYHEIPDVDRRVLTRAENKKVFAKAPAVLRTSLDLDGAVSSCSSALLGVTLPVKSDPGMSRLTVNNKAKGKPKGRQVDTQLSDEVGNFVCGLIYYVSLLEMDKMRRKGDVAFLHIPLLETEQDIEVGVKVVVEVIRSLVEHWSGR